MVPNSTLGDIDDKKEAYKEVVQCVKATNLIGLGVAFLFVLSGKIDLSLISNCIRGVWFQT